VAIAHVTVPCETPNIVESKSFKLYLDSFTNTQFASADEVRDRIRADISEAVWRGAPAQASVGVRLLLPDAFDREPVHELDGLSLDRLDIECTTTRRRRSCSRRLRRAAGGRSAGQQPAQEQLPGDRPARLGQRADPLQRPADRPGRACCATW
jgi:hypothetical protein